MEGNKAQNLVISSRASLNCDSVRDVEEFSDEFVIINTDYGRLSIEGEGLRIKELNEKEGKISIIGKITGLFFRDESERPSFFKRKK